MSLKNIISQRLNRTGGITIGFQCRNGEIKYYEFSALDGLQIAAGEDPSQLSGTPTDDPGLSPEEIGEIADLTSEDSELLKIIDGIADAAADAAAGAL
jgi:hypothetical protein